MTSTESANATSSSVKPKRVACLLPEPKSPEADIEVDYEEGGESEAKIEPKESVSSLIPIDESGGFDKLPPTSLALGVLKRFLLKL